VVDCLARQPSVLEKLRAANTAESFVAVMAAAGASVSQEDLDSLRVGLREMKSILDESMRFAAEADCGESGHSRPETPPSLPSGFGLPSSW
jgi:hypothetical protein